MERELQLLNIQPKEPEIRFSILLREFAERLPRVARFSAPLFLVILAACNNGTADVNKTPVGGTPGINMTALAGSDHILDIMDVCKQTNWSLKACFDVNQDGTVNTKDTDQIRNFVGTTPAYPMDLTGDKQISCEDLYLEEAFVNLYNGAPVESEYEGVKMTDLYQRILTDSIYVFVAPNTTGSEIENILSHSTKYNLVKTDEQGRKNYIIANSPATGGKWVYVQKFPDNVVNTPGFDIVQLREDLANAKDVIAVDFSHADITPAVTFGTPQSCP